MQENWLFWQLVLSGHFSYTEVTNMDELEVAEAIMALEEASKRGS